MQPGSPWRGQGNNTYIYDMLSRAQFRILSVRKAFGLLLLPVVLVGCRKEEPLCGDPSLGHAVSYEIVDAVTGQSWFAGAGRPPADSLRLLVPFQPARRAVRVGSGVRVGPAAISEQDSVTHFLRFSARDLDTVVIRFQYKPVVQQGLCPVFPELKKVDVLYNGKLNSTYSADIPADSLVLFSFQQGKLVRLRKR